MYLCMFTFFRNLLRVFFVLSLGIEALKLRRNPFDNSYVQVMSSETNALVSNHSLGVDVTLVGFIQFSVSAYFRILQAIIRS
jgi:hypothetical protein